MKRQTLLRCLAAACVLGFGAATAVHAVDAKPKYTIKEVMKAAHKGEDNLGKKVSKGQGTPDDFAKLVDYYASLPLNDPPRGDKAAWHEKTTALLDAAKALKAGKPGALEAYKQAVNCKACHSEHKPEDKDKK